MNKPPAPTANHRGRNLIIVTIAGGLSIAALISFSQSGRNNNYHNFHTREGGNLSGEKEIIPVTIADTSPERESRLSNIRRDVDDKKRARKVLTPQEESAVSPGLLDQIKERGPARAASEIARSFPGSEADQRIVLEELTAAWADERPLDAASWIAQNGGDSTLPPPLWDAVVGGYIEGVVVDDPESAAIAADLLQRESPVGEASADFAADTGTTAEREPAAGSSPSDDESPADVATTPTLGAPTFLTDPDNPDPLGLLLTPEERKRRFPGDPGFPGDPNFLRQ